MGRSWSSWGGGGHRSKQVVVYLFTKAREQDITKKQGFPESENSRGVCFPCG
jgi:hypothetical protein